MVRRKLSLLLEFRLAGTPGRWRTRSLGGA
jgi:hypothetical protein